MTENNTQSPTGVPRRQVVQAIAAAAGAGLAGCQWLTGGDGDGDGDGGGTPRDGGDTEEPTPTDQPLGERVPALTVAYFSSNATSYRYEREIDVAKANWEELGLSIDVQGMNVGAVVGSVINDDRQLQMFTSDFSNEPDALDPDARLTELRADFAGGNGLPNWANYANCEYTDAAVKQSTATSQSEREELVNQAFATLSQDYISISTNIHNYYALANTNAVELGGLGEFGFTRNNNRGFIFTTPKDGDRYVVSLTSEITQNRNFLNNPVIAFWNHVPYSSLREYDENYELVDVLAARSELGNDGKRAMFELRDATFHNGDPITAEDVKFTFAHLHNNAGLYPRVNQFPFESSPEEDIRVIDEKTVEFNFATPFPIFLSRDVTKYGIYPKSVWEAQGANENPEEFAPSDFVGSGPFKVANFKQNQSMTLEPHDGHPIWSPDHSIVIQTFSSNVTAVEAFQANEIDILGRITRVKSQQVQEQMDNIREVVTKGIHPYNFYPQVSFAPLKFKELRKALGMALDRREIEQVAFGGQGEPFPVAVQISSFHPWYPGDDKLTKFTDKPEGDMEGARQELAENGWGWDSNGNLHYPADANLNPLWPKGETPNPNDYPCLGEDGSYTDSE